MKKQKALCLVMAAVMTVSSGFTAFASDTKIDKVRLEFSYGETPKSGDDIGDITVKAGGSEYYVESAEYTNSENQDTWTLGDVPEVKVELSARDGYRFSYTSKSHFTLNGCNAKFKRAKVYDSGDYIEVYAELKRIGGKLEGTSNLQWEDTVAEWDEIDGAKSYEVKLLRDEKTVTTVSTTGTSYDFAGYFNREGDYTFRVRAISTYNDKAGEWLDDSDSLSIDEDEIANYGGSGRWVQDGTGWWYSYDTGGYPASCWKQIDGAWYHFNSSGYMQTGWLRLDGEWYYLAGNGAMMTGWQAINGKWYYLGTDGVMYADTWTPDGRYVNGSGAWVQ
ncbi:N-acetylmuramoyl-L-alanine amidase family protein [Enterocloster citroniae]